MRLCALATIAVSAFAFATPAMAHEGGPDHDAAMHHGNGSYPGQWQQPRYDEEAYARQQDEWLRECRQRIGGRRGGATGAILGGVVGGVLGHEVAGRRDKTLGTVAGAAVGAVAGAAIERGTRGRRDRDECEAMLENHMASYSRGGYGPGYAPAYGYAMPMMMVPVTMVAMPAPMHPKKDCKEIVTTEYVTTYDTVYRKVREVRYKSVPTYKRVRIVPDKRVRMVPDKRVVSQ
ncbi:MAG: glycine zipper 2TM domain-containing protein [Novosphingobium sp.]